MISLRRDGRQRIDVASSGALSDLAFLLIIFFIVIAVFNVNSGYLLGLPAPDSTRQVLSEDLARIGIGPGGELSLEGDPISREELADSILSIRQLRPNLTVAVRIHPDAPYEAVVGLVEIVRTVDVDNFSFALEEGR